MKKFMSILLVACSLFMLTFSTGCSATDATQDTKSTEDTTSTQTVVLQIHNPIMKVNGVDKNIDEQNTAPVIVNNRTLLPVRAMVTEMGGNVSWNAEKQEVTLTADSKEIRLTIGSLTAYVNGTAQMLDTAPTIINSRTMLPVRFIAEQFNWDVKWEASSQTVTIVKTTTKAPTAQEPTKPSSKTLVVYFSATGNTKAFAEKIAKTANADLVELVPQQPYTSDDINYNASNCRAEQEMKDESSRPAIATKIDNIEQYDTIILGYPIWWGDMPRIIYTFLDTYDLSGTTIMPFCTSASSGIDSSVSHIKALCPNSNVTSGHRGSSSTSEDSIQNWIASGASK